jgi:hypothetical protein
MTKITVSQRITANPTGVKIYANINEQFKNENYDVTIKAHAITENAEILKFVKDYDVFIYLLSPEFLNDAGWKAEFASVSSMVLADSKKLLIPLTTNEDLTKPFFQELNVIEYLPLEMDSVKYQEDLDWLFFRIESFRRQTFAKAKIDSSATGYVYITRNQLNERSAKLKRQANRFFLLGYLFLASCLAAELYFGVYIINSPALNWNKVYQPAYIFFSNILILTSLVSLSKYLFNIGKSLMSEHLRMADRSHALAFGEFYLKAYNHVIAPSDFKEVFKDWNLNNINSTFSGLNGNDFDPQFLEKISNLVNKIK